MAFFASWPCLVFGFPRSLRSLTRVSLALLMSSDAVLRLSFETLPLSSSPVDLTEFVQVVSAEQRPLAQSSADDSLLELLPPPQPAQPAAHPAPRLRAQAS